MLLSWLWGRVAGVTGTDSYHTALGDRFGGSGDDADDDTLRNHSDQLSIDSFEVSLWKLSVFLHVK
jgi:hypothetical protein